MMFDSHQNNLEFDNRAGERGWAMLGLLLALAIMSMVMASAITPNVTAQVQRAKEEEMLYRGDQMAKAIARYYNNGTLNGIQLLAPPPYGYLTDLKKLRDGVTIGVNERKFVRPSAMIDPMTSQEWEPVRARDPRVRKYLDAWAVENQMPIPQQYLWLAGAPEKLHRATPSEESTQPKPGADGKPGQINPKPPPNSNLDDDDDDDDDDDSQDDPLQHIFGSGSSGGAGSGPGSSNAPIIAVAPKRKGTALKPLYGLTNYEDWIFLYVPMNNLNNRGGTRRIDQPNTNTGRPPISQ